MWFFMHNEGFGLSALQTDTHTSVANAYTWIAYLQNVPLKSLINVIRLYQQRLISSVFTLARQVGIGFTVVRAKGQSCVILYPPCLHYSGTVFTYAFVFM